VQRSLISCVHVNPICRRILSVNYAVECAVVAYLQALLRKQPGDNVFPLLVIHMLGNPPTFILYSHSVNHKISHMRPWDILLIKNTNIQVSVVNIQVSVVTLKKRENISSKQHNSKMAHDIVLMPME